MMNQDQLAFIKSISRSEVSTGFLRELWRAVFAAKKKKASVDPRANKRALRPSSVRADSEARLRPPATFRSSL
jgi:hypothetical protein